MFSRFEQGDSDKLQRFADVCADVDRQLDFLPGLGCKNYPSAIGPIVENLPNFIRSKCEKRVVQYTEDHNDAYPGFKKFAAIIQEQARLKNHPNVLSCTQLNNHKRRTRDGRPHLSDTPEEDTDPNRRVLKSSMESGNITKKNGKEDKFCAFHQRKGHLLIDFKSLENEPLEAKNDCILNRDCASVACQEDTDQPSVLQTSNAPSVEMTVAHNSS